MTVVDAFVGLPLVRVAETSMRGAPLISATVEFFGEAPPPEHTASVDAVVAAMDEAGIDQGLATVGMFGSELVGDRDRVGEAVEDLLEACERFPDRFRASPMIDSIPSIRTVCNKIEELAHHPLVTMMRVVPLLIQEPLNSRTFYPIYERCEALGLSVSINVGVPGPKVRASCQQAIFLDDVLIDFPDLVVVATHMGHPWEDLVVRLMMKFENLYLCNSAYLAKYIEPRVVNFMNSSRGRGKVLFASDFPLLPFKKSIDSARELPLSPDAMEAFLGGNCKRILRWKDNGATDG